MAPAAASSPVKLAKLLVSAWLTVTLFSSPLVDARNARYYHSDNKNKDNRSNRRRHHPSMRHHDVSPNLAIYDNPFPDDDADEAGTLSKLYYERNGLEPPPLISRSTRQRRRIRRIMESGMESNLFDDGSAIDEANTAKSGMLGEATALVHDDMIDTDYATLLRRDLIFSGGYDRRAYPWNYAWIRKHRNNQNQEAEAEGSTNDDEGTTPTATEDSSMKKKRTGVPVEMNINFHRVFSVDVVSPVLDMIVWLRLRWADPRLTWDPKEYGNLTRIWFWIEDGGGGETSEIWTPDIELWNLEDSLCDSLDDTYAIVTHDGSVFWSRPGHLHAACKFYGLDTFPFDTLSCQMEFGSWVYSGKYLRLAKGGGTGFTIGGSETAGESFNEFSFAEDDPVQCNVHVYLPYDGTPDEEWPVLLYNVTIQRSWQPYARGYLLTQILLNIVGFSAFWLPPCCSERMGLSITSMLAAVASEIVVAEKLPASAEYTWFQKFSLLSMGFAFVSLLESVAVLYFYYKRTEDISFTRFWTWYRSRQAQKRGHEILKRTPDAVFEISDNLREKVGQHCHVIIPKKTGSHVTNDSDKCDLKYDDRDSLLDENNVGETVVQDNDDSLDSFEDENKDESLASSMLTQHSSRVFEDQEKDNSLASSMLTQNSCKYRPCEKESLKSIGYDNEDLLSLDPSMDFGLIEARKSFSKSNMNISKLSFDGHISGNISNRVLNDLKSSTILEKGPIQRVCKTSLESNENEDQLCRGTKRVTFHQCAEGETLPEPKEKTVCSPLEPRLSVDSLDSKRESMMRKQQSLSTRSMIIPRDANDFHNEEELENNMKWKIIAARIDDVARSWIPLSFAIALSILFREVL